MRHGLIDLRHGIVSHLCVLSLGGGASFNLQEEGAGFRGWTKIFFSLWSSKYIFLFSCLVIKLNSFRFHFGLISTISWRQLFISTVGSYKLFILPSSGLKLFISKISPSLPWRLNGGPLAAKFSPEFTSRLYIVASGPQFAEKKLFSELFAEQSVLFCFFNFSSTYHRFGP